MVFRCAFGLSGGTSLMGPSEMRGIYHKGRGVNTGCPFHKDLLSYEASLTNFSNFCIFYSKGNTCFLFT